MRCEKKCTNGTLLSVPCEALQVERTAAGIQPKHGNLCAGRTIDRSWIVFIASRRPKLMHLLPVGGRHARMVKRTPCIEQTSHTADHTLKSPVYFGSTFLRCHSPVCPAYDLVRALTMLLKMRSLVCRHRDELGLLCSQALARKVTFSPGAHTKIATKATQV